jgi:hypothetical protein
MAALPPVFVPQATGMASTTLTIPNVPSLAGTALHTQALAVP